MYIYTPAMLNKFVIIESHSIIKNNTFPVYKYLDNNLKLNLCCFHRLEGVTLCCC